MTRRLRFFQLSWPTVVALIAVLAALVAVLFFVPAAERSDLLFAVGGGGAALLAMMRPAGRLLVVGFALLVQVTACGGGAPNLKPAFVSACGAARVACGIVQTACAFAPPADAVAATSGDEAPR